MGDFDGTEVEDARSAAGHAAFGIRGMDDRWIQIQLNTFTNWVNEQLKKVNLSVTDLRTDFSDGVKLCALIELLQQKKIKGVIKKPLNQHQCLENVALALKAMTSDDIKLVNIGGQDVVNGNLKLIMGLVWRAIIRYQISRGKTSPKKLMLSWINACIEDYDVNNFTTDWNNGILLHALLEYCRPGTSPNWKSLNKSDGLKNCRSAMEQAKALFDIPLVVTPENMASPDLDELSGMTYLSYFMKLDSPGYNATLRWVQKQIPQKNIRNFQTDWNDGAALLALVNSLGASVSTASANDPVSLIQTTMNAAKQQLSVEPVITAKEMADKSVDHLGVMAYAAWFQRAALSKARPFVPNVAPSVTMQEDLLTANTFPQTRASQPGDQLELSLAQLRFTELHPVKFAVDAIDGSVNKNQVRVEVHGPHTRPSVAMEWQGQRANCEFLPSEMGTFKIFAYIGSHMVRGSPKEIEVTSPQVTASRPSTSAFLGTQTAIAINAANARLGNVKVEARSPSGQVQNMSISDNGGAYTANFTPTEVGDWNISIMYDGKHIQGSPFSVRVFDAAQVKVFGLEGGSVGNMFSFSVDSSGAGEGQLGVNITHNGRQVPVEMKQEGGKGRYRVHFMPDGSGVYSIGVTFAGAEVPGSPYTLEIVDSANVQVSGEGLGTAELNRRARFVVRTGQAGSARDLRINVTSPRGDFVPCDVTSIGAGAFEAAYTPTEPGEYRIDVSYHGHPVAGSPYRVFVTNNSRISVNNLRPTANLGRPVEFDIDASQGGVGNLEIMINDGQIPCSVQNRGNRQFHATFTPKDPIPHYIQMKFNGMEVPGSPWRVDVVSPQPVTVTGQGVGVVPVNRPSFFDVGGHGMYIDPNQTQVNIVGPNMRQVPHQLVNAAGGGYSVQYLPTEIGNHTINVSHAGVPAQGSPFVSKAFDSSSITVAYPRSAALGGPVELTVDVTQAGEGQLEITVNRGTLPNSVRMLRKGIFLVTFTPREARLHTVEIKFNGELLPRGPVEIPVHDTGAVNAYGDGLYQGLANRESYFRVDAKKSSPAGFDLAQAPLADMTVRVTSPNGIMVPAKIVQQPDGDYKVEYSSKYTGRHKVEILYNGQPIMGSPFFVEIYDPNKIRVEGRKMGNVGQPMEFDLILTDAGQAELVLTVTSPSGHSVPFNLTATAVGKHVTYVPQETGPHYIHITYGGLEVPGLPLTQTIVGKGQAVPYQPVTAQQALSVSSPPPQGSNVRLHGEGLTKATVGQTAQFVIDSKGNRGDVHILVEGPNSILKNRIDQDQGAVGRYIVSYMPVEPGLHRIIVKWQNTTVDGSPYEVKVVDPRKIGVVGGWSAILDANRRLHLTVNETKRIEFATQDAGSGELTAVVTDPHGSLLNVKVDRTVDCNRQTIEFTPRIEGDYTVMLLYSDVPLPDMPLYGVARSATMAINHERVVLTGPGLRDARAREINEFVVDGTEAGNGELQVTMSGVKDDINVDCIPLGDNKYRCSYIPQNAGGYLLNITWSGHPVRGSPFKVNVVCPGDANKVLFAHDSLASSGVGKEVSCVVDTRRAGPGELTASCSGPFKPAPCELKDRQNGTYLLVFVPTETGKHVINVKYGGDHVPGSPMVLQVGGAADPTKVKVYGTGIEDGLLAMFQSHFVCDTRGAGAGQLTVRIRGPKGAFRVEMQRETQKDRVIHCRYDPTEIGEYEVSVKWSGIDVPGSPFYVHIFDTKEELERFFIRNPARRTRPIAVPNLATNGGVANGGMFYTEEE